MRNIAYFSSYMLGFVLFVILVRHLLAGLRARNLHTLVLGFAYVAGMFFAAHFFFFLVHGSLRNPAAADLWSWIGDHQGAFTSAGGLGALVWRFFMSTGGLWGGPWVVVFAVSAYLFVVRLPVEEKRTLGDAAAVALPFALAMCKIGCAVNGCCHGFRWDGPLALRNTLGVSCFPTQLLDLAAYLVVAVVLLALFRRRRAHGRLLLLFVLLFALVRIPTEATRGDHIGIGLGGLTPVQVVLLVGALIAAMGLWRPRLVDRLLEWRSVEPPGAGAPFPETVERSSLRHLLVVAGGSILGLPMVLFPLLFAVLLCLDLRHPHGPERQARMALHTLGLVAGLLFVTAFLVPSLVVFAVVAVAGAALLLWRLDRFFWATSRAT